MTMRFPRSDSLSTMILVVATAVLGAQAAPVFGQYPPPDGSWTANAELLNAKKLKVLPPSCRAGVNGNAFWGGFRLWEEVGNRTLFPNAQVSS
jgi:hypothetical protein